MKKVLVFALGILISISSLSYAALEDEQLEQVNTFIEDILNQLRQEEISQEELLKKLEGLFNQAIVPNLDLPDNLDIADINFEALAPDILNTLPNINNDSSSVLNDINTILTDVSPVVFNTDLDVDASNDHWGVSLGNILQKYKGVATDVSFRGHDIIVEADSVAPSMLMVQSLPLDEEGQELSQELGERFGQHGVSLIETDDMIITYTLWNPMRAYESEEYNKFGEYLTSAMGNQMPGDESAGAFFSSQKEIGDFIEELADYAKKKGKKLKMKSATPTATGKLLKEDGEYSFNVYVWTGVGDPDNIHVDKEYWNSLDDSQKEYIRSQAQEYNGKVIIEDEPTEIELTMHLTPVEGAPNEDHLTDKDLAFIEEHVGDEITVHGWTDDGLVNSETETGEKDTFQVVGLGSWEYEPQHPFDAALLEEEYSFDKNKKLTEDKNNLAANTLAASGHQMFYPCLDRK